MSHESRRNESIEWYTPPSLFAALGLDFDLDPCAPAGGLEWIPARRHFSLHDDGLSQMWRGRVWMNPPYGDQTAKWVGRFLQHGHGVALVFARLDTGWGQAALERSDAVCFVRGRMEFLAGNNTRRSQHAPAPSMLLAIGEDCVRALDDSGLGVVVTGNRVRRYAPGEPPRVAVASLFGAD